MKPWIRAFVAATTLLLFPAFSVSVQSEDGAVWHGNLSKEQKALLLNLAAGAAILTWGAFTWDYGEEDPHFQGDGWFEKDSPEGGADKFGHTYSAYALSHLFYYQYQRWGYDQKQAIQFGCLSSLGVTLLMEIGDSFSDYGFSYQDALFNLIGATIGYGMVKYPEVARKVDFRVEYDPFREGEHKRDFLTDYERLKYVLAFKLDGFDATQNTYLKFFELQVGYSTRGYEDYDEDTGEHDSRRRKIYVGVGLNIGKLLEPFWKTKIFNYIQVPYTYAPLNMPLD